MNPRASIKIIVLGSVLNALLTVGVPVVTYYVVAAILGSTVCGNDAGLAILLCGSIYFVIALPIALGVSIWVSARVLKRLGAPRPLAVVFSTFVIALFICGLAASVQTHLVSLSVPTIILAVFISSILGYYVSDLYLNRLPKKYRWAYFGIGAVVYVLGNTLAGHSLVNQQAWSIDHNAFQIYAPIGYKKTNINLIESEGDSTQNAIVPNYSKGLDMTMDGPFNATVYEYPAKAGQNPAANCGNSPLDAIQDTLSPPVCNLYKSINGAMVYEYQTNPGSELFEIRGKTLIEAEIESGPATTTDLGNFLAAFKPVTGAQFYSMYNTSK